MEQWKSISGFEGYYEVSNLGNVRSFDRYENIGKKGFRIRKGRTLKAQNDKDGYKIVNLRSPQRRMIAKVHRLVAIAFIPNIKECPQVNHVNGIKSDNRIENLEWCFQSHNIKHAFKMGLNRSNPRRGKDHPNYKTGINCAGSFVKSCEYCKKSFTAKIKRLRFCSIVCRNRARKKIAT